MDKLISVIIPTFNRQNLTDVAIESVHCSLPELVEIIIVDDYSSTPFSIRSSINSHGVAVRLVRLDANVGAGMARKLGIEEANGEYIAFLDSDDIFDPGWLNCIISILKQARFKDERVLFSGLVGGGRIVANIVRSTLGAVPAFAQLHITRAIFVFFNPFYTPSIVLHRDLCFFKDGLRHCEDYFSNFASVFLTRQIFLPDALACHLGRAPNSNGGLSGSSSKMFLGEISVRFSVLFFPFVPIVYKFFLPIGLIYQASRVILKFAFFIFKCFLNLINWSILKLFNFSA